MKSGRGIIMCREGESFEDVIRTAVSLGGDCDTLTCIAGSMAEAFYGVPEELKEECRKRITPEMREVLDRFDNRGKTMDKEKLIEELLEKPCLVVDFLPEQVPAGSPGQYFAVDDYFLKTPQLAVLHRQFAEILLKLNGYDDMSVSFDGGETWETNPDPEDFAERVTGLSGGAYLRVLFEARGVMIDLDAGDFYMAVFGAEKALTDRLRKLSAAEGLFFRSPEGE